MIRYVCVQSMIQIEQEFYYTLLHWACSRKQWDTTADLKDTIQIRPELVVPQKCLAKANAKEN